MTADSLIGGLIFSSSCILAHVVLDGARDALAFLRRGFLTDKDSWRRGSSATLCGGVLLFGLLQIYARSMSVRIDPSLRQAVTLPGWVLIVWGVIVWQSSVIADRRGVRVARYWMWSLVSGVVVLTLVSASSGVFHAPIR